MIAGCNPCVWFLPLHTYIVYDREGNFQKCDGRTLCCALALNLAGFFGRAYLILAFIDYRPASYTF